MVLAPILGFQWGINIACLSTWNKNKTLNSEEFCKSPGQYETLFHFAVTTFSAVFSLKN